MPTYDRIPLQRAQVYLDVVFRYVAAGDQKDYESTRRLRSEGEARQ